MPENLPQGFPQVPQGQNPAEYLQEQAQQILGSIQPSQPQGPKSPISPSIRRVQTTRSGLSNKPSASIVPQGIKQALLAETAPKYGRTINAPYYSGEKERAQAGLTLSEEDQKRFKINAEYSDLSSGEKKARIQTLKDPGVNPLTQVNTYDGLAAAYHKWTLIAKNALNAKVSGEMQDRIRDNFYKNMLVPMYQRAGQTPISEELWKKEAWAQDGALTYDIDDAYMNQGMRGIVRGLAHTVQMGENVLETGTNLLGFGLKEGWAFAKGVAKDPLGGVPQTWLDDLHRVADNDPNLFEAAKKQTRDMPILGAISRTFDDRTAQFIADSMPARGRTEWATALGTELVAQAPLFKGLAAANEAGIVGTGLTDVLAKVPAGKWLTKTLMAGTEGSLFGVATRPQEEKDQWWKDGITFMMMSNLTAGLGATAAPWLERFKTSGGLDVLKEKTSEMGNRFKNKVRPLNRAELDQNMIVQKANQEAAAGIVGAEAIDEHGIKLAHDWAERGLNARQINNEIRRMKRTEDPIIVNTKVAAARNVQSMVGKKSIVDVVNNPSELAKLKGQLGALRSKAGEQIVEHNPEVKQAEIKDTAEKAAKQPAAKVSLETVKKELIAAHPDIGAALASGNISPEDVDRLARQEWARRSVEGGIGLNKRGRQQRDALQNVETIGKKRTDLQEARAKRAKTAVGAVSGAKGLKSEVARPVPSTEQETRAAFGGGATSGLQHRRQIDYAWKNFSDSLRKGFDSAKKSGGWDKDFNAWIKDHVNGMEEHDFSEFLHFFLPPEMGPYGKDIFFEKGKAGENPNLMAFLVNYKSMLPPAINTEIRNRLAETVKVNLGLPKNEPFTPSLEKFYGRIVYNHVDNLLGSENVRLSGERNIFKSTAKEGKEQTKWMAESILDRHNQDAEDISTMFEAHPEQRLSALRVLGDMYDGLYKLNNEVFDGTYNPKKAEAWKKASDQVADWMLAQSNLEQSKLRLDKWNIDYQKASTYKWPLASPGPSK